MKKLIFISLFIFSAAFTHAETSVLFHPGGTTLEEIAARFDKAQKQIDIAMYNMDVGGNGPIVQWLNSDIVKKKMADKQLFIRVLLNGKATDKARASKMTALEVTGADVRWLSTSRELHHKFAVIDNGSAHPQVISGSANWSESSRSQYTENVFFVDNEAAFAQAYQNQFNFLWSIADEFGNVGANQDVVQAAVTPSGDLSVDFNVPDASWVKRSSDVTAADFRLTNDFVKAIDKAKSTIRLATTRFRLAPIYDAIKRAAARGVKVQMVLTQAEYAPYYRRDKFKSPTCTDLYTRECSLNTNYAIPLLNQQGIEIRAKTWSLKSTDGIMQQMHNKYLIVDDSLVLSGSFNLSISSEFGNFENVAQFSGPSQAATVAEFAKNFDGLWELNRARFAEYLITLDAKLKAGEKFSCLYPAMILSFSEMDEILKVGEAHKVRLEKACN
jgi:phosphatidylserine/phosphatidylglycerophosphate/cardiolipin synthase-like enzyme